MKLTVEQIKGIVRELFAFIAAMVAVYGVTQIGGINAADVIGTIVWAVFVIWGVADKSNTDKSAIFSVFRKLFTLAGAIIAFYFPVTQKFITTLLPTAMVIISIIASQKSNAPVTK